MLLLSLLMLSSAPTELSALPTLTTAHGLKQSYAVVDGQLMIRTDGNWQGVAPPPEAKAAPVSVSADEDGFYVLVTADGMLHAHFPCPDGEACEPYVSRWGLPFLERRRRPLALPFAIEQLRVGRLAFSQRHQAVQYYQEPSGRQVNWGRAGTTSVFALDNSGTRILLADPWLPPDFAREIPPPMQGTMTMTMASIAASASQLMAITVDGRVFTRFDDYDINGGTPFFVYGHEAPLDDAYADEPAGSLDSEAMTRLVPSLGWVEHARVPGRSSRRIAIEQNGVGNDTRKMSVVGEQEGARGIFHKNLQDATWVFTPAAEDVADGEWLDAAVSSLSPSPRLSMSGWWRAGDRQVFTATDDFWFHAERAHFTLSDGDGEVTLDAQLADAWTLFAADNVVEDGHSHRNLMVTLTTTPEGERWVRERLGGAVADRLGTTFGFALVANQTELVLVPVSHPTALDALGVELVMTAQARSRSRAVVSISPYSELVADMGGLSTETCTDAERQRRQAMSIEVNERHEDALSRARSASLLAGLLPPALVIMDVATVVSTTRWWLPTTRYLVGLEQHLPAILTAQQLSTSRWLTASDADLRVVQQRLDRCR